MYDYDLAVHVIAAFRAGGFDPVMRIVQNNQPAQRGRPTGPCLLFEKTGDKRYGWVRREDVPDAGEPTGVVHTETQVYHTTFQVNALATPPSGTSVPTITASDIINDAAAALQSDRAISYLLANGISIYRITDIRNPAFVNDQGQFERVPSFDFVVSHDQVKVNKAPSATIDALAVVHV